MNAVVIAHYNEDLSWTDGIDNLFIYSKSINGDRFINNNKGQEVPAYLRFIIDNYYKLPNKTLFMHGHSNSPHQDFCSRYIVDNINWELGSYFSINKRAWYQEVSERFSIEQGVYKSWIVENWGLFSDYLQLPITLKFYSGAQFCVNKELIEFYPLDYYKGLLFWVEHTNVNTYITSRIFEYMWHYLFTRNPIEIQRGSEIYERIE